MTTAALQGSYYVGGFSPTNIVGLGLWLRSTDRVDTSANKVTKWYDLSLRANDASPVIGNGNPTLIPSVLNGLPAIRFGVGGPTPLLLQQVANYTNVFDYTVFVVASNAITGQLPLLSIDPSKPRDPFAEYALSFEPQGVPGYDTGYLNVGIYFPGFGYNHVLGGQLGLNKAFTLSAFADQYLTNSSGLGINGNYSNPTLSPGAVPQEYQSIGYIPGYPFVGDIFEIIVYDRKILPQEMLDIDLYLKNRYNHY